MNEDISYHPAPPQFLTEHRIMVFLVDDQPMVGEAVRRQLSGQSDMDFHYCSDAAEAIPLASRIRPTVILQDLIMPGVDGLTLVRKFRQTPETKNIPIIVLSSKEEPEIKSQAFTAGANDYLIKLPDKIELIARIYYHSRAYLNQIERDEAYRALRQSQRQLVDSNMALTQLSEKLRQYNEALQAAECLARMGSWSWDIATDEITWSKMLREIFRWDIAKPAPRFEDLKTIFTSKSFAAFREVAEQCVKSGKSYSLELEGFRSGGEHFFINAKGQAARAPSGEVVRVFGSMHDITEQRKLGEIAQKTAVLEERARIAGEIHDSLAQSFAAIVMQTEIAEEQLSGSSAGESMENIAKVRELARFGLAEARRSAHTLRLSYVLQSGLVVALRQLSQRTSVKDILICETKIGGEPRRLDPLVEHELFRVAQEALNNAVRHAKSTRITLGLYFKEDHVIMTIEDNGIGFPLEGAEHTEGVGLVTMRERVEKTGGTFAITSKPGSGTRIEVTSYDAPRPLEIQA